MKYLEKFGGIGNKKEVLRKGYYWIKEERLGCIILNTTHYLFNIVEMVFKGMN